MNDVFQFLTMRFFNDVYKKLQNIVQTMHLSRCIAHPYWLVAKTEVGASDPVFTNLSNTAPPVDQMWFRMPLNWGKAQTRHCVLCQNSFFAQRWLILSKFLGIEERIGGCTLCCRINVKDIKRRRINIYRWEGSNQNKTDWPWQGRKVDNGMRNIKDVHPELFNLF